MREHPIIVRLLTSNTNGSRDTQQYCATLITEIEKDPKPEDLCGDCVLRGVQQNLNSPFGYHPDIASSFVTLTAACSKSGYAFTSPPPYALPTSTSSGLPGASTLPPRCLAVHTVVAGDTCNSIAVQRNISSYTLYGPTSIRDCNNLKVGLNICIVTGQCRRHTVKAGDTCDSIVRAAGIQVDAEVFWTWNPNIHIECTNLAPLAGQEICLRCVQHLEIILALRVKCIGQAKVY
jgi:LysM repeat protein